MERAEYIDRMLTVKNNLRNVGVRHFFRALKKFREDAVAGITPKYFRLAVDYTIQDDDILYNMEDVCRELTNKYHVRTDVRCFDRLNQGSKVTIKLPKKRYRDGFVVSVSKANEVACGPKRVIQCQVTKVIKHDKNLDKVSLIKV